MRHTKVLAALSVAMILGAAPAAIAAQKHADAAKGASANASARPALTTDHGFQTLCGVNPECNGWGDWLRRVKAGDQKLYLAPPGS
jgi:hypothetical protein